MQAHDGSNRLRRHADGCRKICLAQWKDLHDERWDRRKLALPWLDRGLLVAVQSSSPTSSMLQERRRAEEAHRESEARYRILAARTHRLYNLNAALSEAVALDAVAKAALPRSRACARLRRLPHVVSARGIGHADAAWRLHRRSFRISRCRETTAIS
jgi:hypothetical protein